MSAVLDYVDRYRPNTPEKEIGIGNFTALVRVRESYKLTADVPATPVEDGSFINDHIILNPIALSIEGSVSDIHLRQAPIIRDFIRVQAEIGNLSSQYATPRTQSQLNKISALANDAADAVRQLDALVSAGEQAASFFGNKDASSKSLREQFLDQMEALYFGKQAFTIDMPYRQHTNMTITSFTSSTDNTTAETTFTLEASQLRFAELQIVAIAPSPSSGAGGQLDGETDQGAQEGTPVERSLFGNVVDAFN